MKRKLRKTNAEKAKPVQNKPFCPPYILRYDNLNNQFCQTVWGCKYCTQIMLSEESVVTHQLLCKDFTPEVINYCTKMDKLKKLKLPQRPIPVVVLGDNPNIYVCSFCKSPYKRRAAMITHERLMHKLVDDVDDKSEDDETPIRRKRTYRRKNQMGSPVKIKTEIKTEIKEEQDCNDLYGFTKATPTPPIKIKSEF